MSRSGNYNRQTSLDSDTAFKRKQLKGDLSLVVIHGHNSIVLASLEKNGITRKGTLNVDALRSSSFHSRNDEINLLAAKVSVLAIVWVQGTNCKTRTFDAGLPPFLSNDVSESIISIAYS